MTQTANNVPDEVVVNPLFVRLALEAGIEAVIRGIVNATPMGLIELVVTLRTELWEVNPPLAQGLTVGTLRAILSAIDSEGRGVAVSSNALPGVVDVAGPASVTFGYDNPPLMLLTVTAPPAGWQTVFVLDGVIVHVSNSQDGGGGFADSNFNISLAAGTYALRALYRNPAGELGRLSAPVQVVVS